MTRGYVGTKRRQQRRLARRDGRPPLTPRAAAVCAAKIAYASGPEAHAAAAGIRRREGRVLRPYRCAVCLRWHHTSRARP